MNISLTRELEEFVHEKVKSGLYHSSSEVIRDALRLLTERDHFQQMRLDELRKEIMRGYEQAERGELYPMDMKALKARAKARMKKAV
jgi:antitoxin ParD1/3/4